MARSDKSELWTELRAAIEREIEGVEFVDSDRYYIVKLNGETLGTVEGKQRVRVRLPQQGRRIGLMSIADSHQIPAAIEQLRSYA